MNFVRFCYKLLFHPVPWTGLITCTVISEFLFRRDVRHEAFCWHPVLMIFALLSSTFGRTVHLERAQCIDDGRARCLHGSLMAAASIFLLVGLSLHLSIRLGRGRGVCMNMPRWDMRAACFAHVAMGYSFVFCFLLQATVGFYVRARRGEQSQQAAKVHWFCGCFLILIAQPLTISASTYFWPWGMYTRWVMWTGLALRTLFLFGSAKLVIEDARSGASWARESLRESFPRVLTGESSASSLGANAIAVDS